MLAKICTKTFRKNIRRDFEIMASEGQTKVNLTVIKGPEQGQIFEFTEQDNFLLGRDAPGSHAHFRLGTKDMFVSRNHFLLEINPPDCYLRDAGSLNGTFIIRRSCEKIVFFLEGRKERKWIKTAKSLASLFQCESYQEVEKNIIKLEDSDLICVGDTIVEVKITQEIPKETLIIEQEPQPEDIFHCIRCGRDITSEIQSKEADKLTSADFICEECCGEEESEKLSPSEVVTCWECSKDLTSLANADGRAEELRDIALYWCKDCADTRDFGK